MITLDLDVALFDRAAGSQPGLQVFEDRFLAIGVTLDAFDHGDGFASASFAFEVDADGFGLGRHGRRAVVGDHAAEVREQRSESGEA